MVADWQAKGEAKRQAILDSIPAKWKIDKIPSALEQRDVTGPFIQQFLSQEEVEITETDAIGIARRVATGEWSALKVTEAFCHRAALAHQLVNCLHEIFFDAAIADAKELDAYFKEHKKTKGVLHGVPVSLKDQFHVKNVDTSMGYIGWLGTFEGKKDDSRYGIYESLLVSELRNLGAVLYCKTSVPHTLSTGETVNNIIGYTWNPKNRNLSSGGSSGGEGALIALKGSPLGFGTDIGGSVRIPAAFNGLYGIRPSACRLPYEGVANSMDGQNSILSVVGPLASTAASLKLAMQAILSQKPHLYDPLVVDMPWRSSEEQAAYNLLDAHSGQGGLCFGLFKYDGTANPQPPVSRAIDLTVAVLKGAGHKIIEWDPPSHTTTFDFMPEVWAFDGVNDICNALKLSGEPLSPQVQHVLGNDVPRTPVSAIQVAATNVKKRQKQKLYMDYWNSTAEHTGTGRPADAIITPLAVYAAARPNAYTYYANASWVNGMDYTSVTVPITIADKNVDVYPEGWKAANDVDQGVYDNYDPTIYDGAYVGIQLVGRRFQEEKMLVLAEYIGKLVTEENPVGSA